MSKHKSKARPVSSHPLFPLVVAIWFAALFGLGGLAIRPSALESIVLALQLDTVVPAAAPPLGVTARLLVALVLAGLGTLLGFVLGQRLRGLGEGRRARKRGVEAGSDPAEALHARTADDLADAPLRRPLSASEDLAEDGLAPVLAAEPDDEDDSPAPARRRRALAVTDESRRSEFLDMAPLPGMPVIAEPAQLAPAPEPAPAAVLDLTELAPEPEPAPVPPLAIEPAAAAPELDWSQARPLDTPRQFDAPPAVLRQDFALGLHDEDADADPAIAAPVLAHPAFSAPEPPPEPVPEPAPVAAAPAAFAPPIAASAEPPRQIFNPPAAQEGLTEPEAARDVDASAVVEALAQAQSESEPEPEAAPVPEPAAIAPRTAAENMAAPDLGALGMVELAERLARAMERRREGRGEAAPAQFTPPAPLFASAPAAAPLFAGAPAAVLPLAAEAPAADAPADTDAAMPEPAPAPEPAPEPAPVAIEGPAEPAPRFARLPGDGASAAPAVPALFRPFDAVTGDEDEDEADESFALPSLLSRSPAAPASAAPASAEPVTPAPGETGTEAPAEPEDESDEESESDAAYSSLLELGRRQAFVRVEDEPQPQSIEPVVIFPGQSGGAATGAPRLFDPPGTLPAPGAVPAGGQSFAAPAAQTGAAAAKDPEETERALRAALASLQRMSGAA